MLKLSEQRIQTRPIWGLIHEQKPYRGAITYQIEAACWYHDRVLNIPCSTNLTKKEIIRVVDTIKEVTTHGA